MEYGIGDLSIVPLRAEPSDKSEMVSQVLYGEHFKVLEKRKKWSHIRLAYDNYQGWIDNKQYRQIEENEYQTLSKTDLILSSDVVDFVSCSEGRLQSICMGSHISSSAFLKHHFD